MRRENLLQLMLCLSNVFTEVSEIIVNLKKPHLVNNIPISKHVRSCIWCCSTSFWVVTSNKVFKKANTIITIKVNSIFFKLSQHSVNFFTNLGSKGICRETVIFSRFRTQSAEGTKESRTRVRERVFRIYSSTSLVRASVVHGPSVVRGFEWQNFSSL